MEAKEVSQIDLALARLKQLEETERKYNWLMDSARKTGVIVTFKGDTMSVVHGLDSWIDADKEKPAAGVVVMVAVRSVQWTERDEGGTDEREFYTVCEGQYTVNEHGGYMEVFMGRIGDVDNVTHWMPLPTPPALK